MCGPVSFVNGFAGILRDGVLGPLSPDQIQAVDRIREGSDRLLHLVDRLISFARIQDGTFKVEPREQNYAPVVEGVVSAFEPFAARKGVSLGLEPGFSGAGLLDPHATTLVLCNLVDNAVKFTPAGGRVSVRTRREEGFILTEVADSGAGIAAGDLGEIRRRLRKGGPGTAGGLGIGIVGPIVAAHGGEVRVHSVPGEGTTFAFTLPAGR